MAVQDKFQYLTLVVLSLLFACKQNNNSIQKNSISKKDTLLNTEVERQKVEKVKKKESYKIDSNHFKIVTNETFKDSIYWKSNSKGFYLKATLEEEGSFFTENWKSVLSINFFKEVEKGDFDFFYQYKDGNKAPYLKMVPMSIFVDSVNKKDKEVYLVYRISTDGLDPDLLRVIAFKEERANVIEGYIPKTEDESESYTKTVDSLFKEKHPFAYNYSSKLFDYYASELKKKWW